MARQWGFFLNWAMWIGEEEITTVFMFLFIQNGEGPQSGTMPL